MTELAALSPDAAGYLRDSEDGGIPHKFWASYAFPGRRFDHVTSNLSEIANSALRLHRELPPLQLLVAVYNYEMGHFYDRLQKATAWKDILAPHPHSLFVEALQHCRKLNCTPASENTGLVRGSTGKEYNVKLAADPLTSLSSCSCGVPQLMLLPCAHICALAASRKKAAVLYAHSYWSIKHWRVTYQKAYIVAELDNLDANELDAPGTSTRQKKGRPQKQRREAGKGGSSMREPVAAFCSRCGEPDHTARQCRTAH
ncbi:hypothetical protein CF326_g4218 [Tilletia indica]|nr:hypothetical protein CF326_g4218 [Tilletia indica]